MIEHFVKIVNGFKSLSVFPKGYFLDAFQGSEYGIAYLYIVVFIL